LIATVSPTTACLTLDVGGKKVAFDDFFSGTRLDRSRWNTCYPWWPDQAKGCTNEGNVELEWYLPSQVTVSKGALHLTARRDPVTVTVRGRRKTYPFRSGMVTTAGHFSFEYGIVSMRARARA